MVTDNKPSLVTINFDGVEPQVPAGANLVDALGKIGKEVPHYCYHPKLPVAGNCRMCLVELGSPMRDRATNELVMENGQPKIGWQPKPAIACATNVSAGLHVRLESPGVKACREGVTEMLLLNHPLDCPICDQAGECKLQEFSAEYGRGYSRYVDEKNAKPKKTRLGPRVTLDDERCILCSRCVRFSSEIAKDPVLGFVNRGSYNTLTCFPGRELDNNYSLNTVDICPVGALTSTDFRFKMRVWFLKETKSIDVNDGLGCNILIGSRENHIYRITPRENNDVNGNWIPDSHRLNFKYLQDEHRLSHPSVDGKQMPWPETISAAVSSLKAAGTLAMVLSARLTNEELYLARLLSTALKVSLHDVVPRVGEPDGILIPADRNPNTAGAQLLGATGKEPGKTLPEIVAGVRSGAIQGLICLGEDLSECGFNPADLKKLKALVATSILPTDTTKAAHIVLPGAAWAEKRGSMINIHGRLQRLNKGVEPAGEAHDDWEILRDLLVASGSPVSFHEIEDVFRAMSQDIPAFAGLNLSKIGDLGVQLLPKPETVAATV